MVDEREKVLEKLMVEARLHLDEPMIRYKTLWNDCSPKYVGGRSREEAFLALCGTYAFEMGGHLDDIDRGLYTVAFLFADHPESPSFETQEIARGFFQIEGGDIPDDAVVLFVDELCSPMVKPCRVAADE